MKRIGIIGSGVMGSAIARSLGDGVMIYDTQAHQLAQFKGESDIVCTSSLDALLQGSETVILAVKPQSLPSLYPALAPHDRLWISIAAGISLTHLSSALKSTKIIRMLPNIAALQKRSVTAVAAHPGCTRPSVEQALTIARSFGDAIELEERLFDGFIGISASAIAYMLHFVNALALGAVAEGIPYPDAQRIITSTMESATALLKASGAHPIELASRVCSAKGTTIEGLQALAEGGFDATVMDAVRRSAEKSRILEAEALHHTNSEGRDD